MAVSSIKITPSGAGTASFTLQQLTDESGTATNYIATAVPAGGFKFDRWRWKYKSGFVFSADTRPETVSEILNNPTVPGDIYDSESIEYQGYGKYIVTTLEIEAVFVATTPRPANDNLLRASYGEEFPLCVAGSLVHGNV